MRIRDNNNSFLEKTHRNIEIYTPPSFPLLNKNTPFITSTYQSTPTISEPIKEETTPPNFTRASSIPLVATDSSIIQSIFHEQSTKEVEIKLLNGIGE